MSYSRNNEKTFEQFLTLGGFFAGIITGYINVLTNEKFVDYRLHASIVTLIVLSFLCVISILFGYSRRRDHIISSHTCENNSVKQYKAICGDGTNIKLFSYLPDYYLAFFFFFIIVLVLFIIFLLCSNNSCYEKIITITIGTLTVLIPIIVFSIKYKQYKELCTKANQFDSLNPHC